MNFLNIFTTTSAFQTIFCTFAWSTLLFPVFKDIYSKILSTFATDMETVKGTVETLIASVLSDIRIKGYSSVPPFCIGKVEVRMVEFALTNSITLASDELYMSAKQLQHCMRASKASKSLVVSDSDLIAFPNNRFQMDLYYDGECFIYTDGMSKFIIHPNYKMKISRELVTHVNFITATRVKDPAEFTLPKYQKI